MRIDIDDYLENPEAFDSLPDFEDDFARFKPFVAAFCDVWRAEDVEQQHLTYDVVLPCGARVEMKCDAKWAQLLGSIYLEFKDSRWDGKKWIDLPNPGEYDVLIYNYFKDGVLTGQFIIPWSKLVSLKEAGAEGLYKVRHCPNTRRGNERYLSSGYIVPFDDIEVYRSGGRP